MRRVFIIITWCFVANIEMFSQNVDDVLHEIEQNNKELQAQRQATDAAKLSVRAQNGLEDPSVEYSPFFAKNVDGMASSELVVRQGFDFPTVYAARHRSGELQQHALERQLQAVRQEILLEAKTLCLDLIRLRQERLLLEQRKKNADELLSLTEERLKKGHASVLELNKVKMEQMNVHAEVARNNADTRTIESKLQAMNGDKPFDFTGDTYPRIEPVENYSELYDEVMSGDVALQASDVAAKAADKEVDVNRQKWLPKLEVAYRRNTSLGEKSNGFLIGGSIPIFSNKRNVKIAKAEAMSAQAQLESVRSQVKADIESQYHEMLQLRETMSAFDVVLMHKTLRLLHDAVKAGQLSVADYYVEVENVYKNLQAYMGIENQYQKLMALIYKNRL